MLETSSFIASSDNVSKCTASPDSSAPSDGLADSASETPAVSFPEVFKVPDASGNWAGSSLDVASSSACFDGCAPTFSRLSLVR